MPTYLRNDYLPEAIRSVTAQRFRDFDVLVCDNGASEETAHLVEEFGDERFTYLPRPENLGMVANAYDGLRRASGEFVMKLDDDDVLEPDFLETLVTPMTADATITVSAADFSLIDAEGRPLLERQAGIHRTTRPGPTPGGPNPP